MTRVPPPLQPQDRLHLTNAPAALPGTCLVCNRSPDGGVQFIDFNHSFDYYGAIYICVPCAVPLAHAIGYVEVDLLKDAESEISDLKFEREGLEDELRDCRSALDALRLIDSYSDRPTLANGQDKEQNDRRPTSSIEQQRTIDRHSV